MIKNTKKNRWIYKQRNSFKKKLKNWVFVIQSLKKTHLVIALTSWVHVTIRPHPGGVFNDMHHIPHQCVNSTWSLSTLLTAGSSHLSCVSGSTFLVVPHHLASVCLCLSGDKHKAKINLFCEPLSSLPFCFTVWAKAGWLLSQHTGRFPRAPSEVRARKASPGFGWKCLLLSMNKIEELVVKQPKHT